MDNIGNSKQQTHHPTPMTYVKVAGTLGILTALEVGILYVDALEPFFLTLFLVLSVVKFALVIMFYMHLKYDDRMFSGLFLGGLFLAVAVVLALMILFQVVTNTAGSKHPNDDIAVTESLNH